MRTCCICGIDISSRQGAALTCSRSCLKKRNRASEGEREGRTADAYTRQMDQQFRLRMLAAIKEGNECHRFGIIPPSSTGSES